MEQMFGLSFAKSFKRMEYMLCICASIGWLRWIKWWVTGLGVEDNLLQPSYDHPINRNKSNTAILIPTSISVL